MDAADQSVSPNHLLLKQARRRNVYMGRASDVFRRLNEQPVVTEDDRLGGRLPPLKLKPEMVIDSLEPSRIGDALRALRDNGVKNALIRDADTGIAAVMIPVERYVALVGRELQFSNDAVVDDAGKLQPAGLADSEVELEDANASWPHLS